jgi:hypothetical protein
MPDERLRRYVLDAIARGALPPSLPRKTWGGFGAGERCSACGRTIRTDQLETEFEDSERRPFHLHIQCFATWEVLAVSRGASEPSLPVSLTGGDSVAGEHS